MQMSKHIHEWFVSGDPETTKIGIVSFLKKVGKLSTKSLSKVHILITYVPSMFVISYWQKHYRC